MCGSIHYFNHRPVNEASVTERPVALPPFGRGAAMRRQPLYIIAIAFGVVVPLGAATVVLVLVLFQVH
jgi:hypothetical protein